MNYKEEVLKIYPTALYRKNAFHLSIKSGVEYISILVNNKSSSEEETWKKAYENINDKVWKKLNEDF